MKTIQNFVSLSLACILTVLSVSATTLDSFGVEKEETQKNSHHLTAFKKATFFIDTAGEPSFTHGAPEQLPVSYYNLLFWKAANGIQSALAIRTFQQLKDSTDSSVTSDALKERIYPFHSHW